MAAFPAWAAACLLAGPLALPVRAAPWTYTVVDESAEGDYDLQAEVVSDAQWPPQGEARVAFDLADARNCYVAAAAGGGFRLLRVTNGVEQPVGDAAPLDRARTSHKIIVKRRADTITLVADGGIVTTICDPRRPGRQVAVATQPETVHMVEPLVQPVAEVAFSDDFVREESETGGWEPLVGRWQPSGPQGPAPHPELAANPFTFEGGVGERQDFALAAVGDWFWDCYEVRAAVKAASSGAIGLAGYVQDADNYLAVRWTEEPQREGDARGRAQLVQVRDGKWRLLAQSDGGFVRNRWYDLKLRVDDRRLQFLVDDAPVLEAEHDSFGCGRAGLYVAACERAYFDDVTVRSRSCFRDDFKGPELPWSVLLGTTKRDQGHLYLSGTAATPAAMLVPDSQWPDWQVQFSVKPKQATSVGLLLGYRDQRNYTALRWARDGQLDVRSLREGHESHLAAVTAARAPDEFHQLLAACLARRLIVTVDGRLVLELPLSDALPGPIGLLTEGKEAACFDSFEAEAVHSFVPDIEITKQYTLEDTMTGWTHGANFWAANDQDRALYYRTPVFGDSAVVTPIVAPPEQEWSVTAGFGAEGTPLDSTATVTVRRVGPPRQVQAEVRLAGNVVAQGTAEAPEGDLQLRLARRGTCLEARLNEQSVIIARLPAPPDGRRLGLRAEGVTLDLDRTVVFGPQLWDYTFSGAPTDFAPQAGTWEITDRWPCKAGWAWYGCKKTDAPLLWTNRRFFGDQTCDIWCALVMDMDHEPGYTDPSNLNAILCGNGKELCSGYGFVYAGEHNTMSTITRGPERVVQNDTMRFDNPVSMNLAFQRHWFHLHLEKRGAHISFSVDDQLVGEYDDPNPLDGGQVGVWSWNNGIVVARMRISADRSEP